jgi:hypothetical protein
MANNNIIKILSTKFSEDEAKALAGEIDQRIKKVAFELIKENLCVTGSDPYARLHWNKQTLDYATFKDSKHLNPEVESDEQKQFRKCWLDFAVVNKRGK